MAAVDFTIHAEAIGRHFFGEPNKRLSKSRELRWGANGSIKVDLDAATWFDFEQNEGGGLLDLVKLREGYTEDREVFDWMREIGLDVPEPESPGGAKRSAREERARPSGRGQKSEPARHKRSKKKTIKAVYDYTDEDGEVLYQVVRFEPKSFGQRRVMPDGAHAWSLMAGRFGRERGAETWRKLKDGERAAEMRELDDVRLVPYRLPRILEALGRKKCAREGRGSFEDADAKARACTPIFIVEGEKDVATLEQRGFVATCNAGGAKKWQAGFAALFAGADVVVIPDNDPAGRNHAEAVCASLIGTAQRVRRVDLAEHCPALEEKGDITDWFADHGGTADALREIVDRTEDWNPRAPEPEFPLYRFADLIGYAPKEEWLVDGWLGDGQLGVLFGPPKSGKSFIALDMAMRITHGWPWLGRDTRQGGVFYIAAEGGDGVKKRVALWAQEFRDRRVDAPFFLAPHRFDFFSDAKGVDAIIGYLSAASSALNTTFRMIVVDTLARVFGGGDENFAGDMNRLIESCDRLRAETGC